MLNQDVERYATLQRTLGYKFGEQSRSLKQFADYAMAHGDEFVRVERVLAWAAQTPSVQRRSTLVARVRRFALALHAEHPRHEVPPRDCVGHAKATRKRPYIYTADDIDRIMRAARQMPAKGFIGPETLTTLLGLLASTGLRISEALSLQCSDMVALSTYLGHTNVTDTYWYLEATSAIMSGIAKAGEAMHRGGAA